MTTPKWNSIIVEQASAVSHGLKTLLKAHCPQIKVLAQVSEAVEAIACIQRLRPNLLFCNVELRDGSAFDLLDQLEGFLGHLILLSESEAFAIRAIRYKAFDYLLTPVTESALLKLMKRLEIQAIQPGFRGDSSEEGTQRKKFTTIILSAGGVQHMVSFVDIIHLEGDGNYSTVHLAVGDKILVSKPLKYFESILPAKTFFRVHQSHIVNLGCVKSVQNGDQKRITLSNGALVPLARRKKDPFLDRLAEQ